MKTYFSNFMSFNSRDLHLHIYLHIHYDVIQWNTFPRYWSFVRRIHRSPVDSPHKGQWHGALMFPLICAWPNSWANNRDAGDLRPYRSHYNVTVMFRYTSDGSGACCMMGHFGTWIYRTLPVCRSIFDKIYLVYMFDSLIFLCKYILIVTIDIYYHRSISVPFIFFPPAK